MITEKEYDFYNYTKKNDFFSLKDHHRTIITDVMRSVNRCIIGKNFHPIIVVGIEGLVMLDDMAGFNYTSPKMILNNSLIRFEGLLFGRQVYSDLRLQPNKILVGTDLQEIEQFITRKNRKEKLIKLYDKIG